MKQLMNNDGKTQWFLRGLILVGILSLTAFAGCEKTGGEGAEEESSSSTSGAVLQPPPPAPAEYADKHMPEGWWADPEIIEQGRQLYIGAENIDVNCAACHGKNGKPVKKGARDFRQAERMQMFSDSQWFWRVSEGVKGTKMPAWKKKLTSEEDRWKVISYERTFGLPGLGYDVARGEWVPVAELGQSAPETDAAPASDPAEGDAPASHDAPEHSEG